MSYKIENISWGKMMIESVGTGKDFKLWPGGGRQWDWSETKTHHNPGIQPSDVEELLKYGSQSIVLSRGMLLMLNTCQETLDLLESEGIEIHRAETIKATEIYNRLVIEGKAVGGLFHSTC